MKRILFVALPLLVLAGCYPGGAEYTEELDAVYTTYNEKYDFQSKSTYSMPDKIVIDVEIDRGDTTFVYMKDVFAAPILQAIEANMASYGWTKVNISASPNLLITPAALKSTTYFYSYWYDWWYGGWYGGWGWYYPPYYTVSSYTTGSLIITMADPNEGLESPILESQAAWLGVMNGLYTGANNVSRVTSAINDAFAQSPYLKTN